MRAEIHRDGRWIACGSWRLQRSVHHVDDQLELRGYHGGPIVPPWRIVDEHGTPLVSSDDERRPEERRSLVETDESPTTSPHSSAESRTT